MSGPRLGVNGMGALPGWADLEAAIPQVAATMRRYLTQIGCVLRPGSVGGADLALRCFAAFLAQAAPEVTSTAQVTRRHIEDYKPWLAARPGQNKPRLTPGDHRPPARHAADVLHPPGRMGLGRGPAEGADVHRRPAPPRPPAAQSARRCQRRETAARRAERQAPARARHGGDAAAHRPAGQRVHQPARRRGRADRRRRRGCTSRSASSARTATCRCTRTWSP